jgi:hypothetical protein
MQVRLLRISGVLCVAGFGLVLVGLVSPSLIIRILVIIVGILILLPVSLLFWLWLQSGSKIGSIQAPMKTWVVRDDGSHNAFTDMVFWNESFWLVFISSPSHFASDQSRVVLLRSRDGRDWQTAHEFGGDGQDIRDPKLGIIAQQLAVFALLNKSFDAAPYASVTSLSKNGLDWTPFRLTIQEGWLIGRPITKDGTSWYAPAHRLDTGSAALLSSTDGLDWRVHSRLFDGNIERADETAMQLLKDGRLLAITRLEAGSSILGSDLAATLVSISEPPFTEWRILARNRTTRLDGPVMFMANDQIYAVGRRQVEGQGSFWLKSGSVFSKKRTSIFHVEEKTGELVYLADLPSSGDTSYAGVVARDGKILICYYTNEPTVDYPWLLGMLLPTRIQIVELEIEKINEFKG